ncbi:MAG: hypothetical protein JXQ73_13695 [Phycisphaerae bacterium]|nr:hypothetical protein [Phycisphaerae bacterium]
MRQRRDRSRYAQTDGTASFGSAAAPGVKIPSSTELWDTGRGIEEHLGPD